MWLLKGTGFIPEVNYAFFILNTFFYEYFLILKIYWPPNCISKIKHKISVFDGSIKALIYSNSCLKYRLTEPQIKNLLHSKSQFTIFKNKCFFSLCFLCKWSSGFAKYYKKVLKLPIVGARYIKWLDHFHRTLEKHLLFCLCKLRIGGCMTSKKFGLNNKETKDSLMARDSAKT